MKRLQVMVAIGRYIMGGCCALAIAGTATADVWVFEPSASIDSRIDDNYRVGATDIQRANALRVVGGLGLSRESRAQSIEGAIRIDGLILDGDPAQDEFDSNQYVFLNSVWRQQRSELGIDTRFRNDTPSRDISSDITEISTVASDTGRSAIQTDNVGRRQWLVEPFYRYDYSRRTTLRGSFRFESVEHSLRSPDDAYRQRLIEEQSNDPSTTLETLGRPFVTRGELSDFRESRVGFNWRHLYSPLTTLSANISYRSYVAEVEQDQSLAIVPFDLQTFDGRAENTILRWPRYETKSGTLTLTLGFERRISPTMMVGVNIGAFQVESDTSDLYNDRDIDNLPEQIPMDFESGLRERVEDPVTREDGYLGSLSFDFDDGVAQYRAAIAVDVEPDDASGTQVLSQRLTLDYARELSRRWNVLMRVEAYEPDAINLATNEFDRRFLSVEPRLIWQLSRDWTAAMSYRYRRQSSRVAPEQNQDAVPVSGESNAVLLSFKYAPPSKIEEARAVGGQ